MSLGFQFLLQRYCTDVQKEDTLLTTSVSSALAFESLLS